MLVSCGYKPIFTDKNTNFKIETISTESKNKIFSKAKKNLIQRFQKPGATRFFDLEIDTSKKIKIASKDKKGNPLVFNMTVNMALSIFEKNSLISKKTFSQNFIYNNSLNKFSLKQYEKVVEDNLVNKILEDVYMHLISLD